MMLDKGAYVRAVNIFEKRVQESGKREHKRAIEVDMNAQFIEVRDASGAYAAGRKVAIFRWSDGSTFELSRHDVGVRRGARRSYGEPHDQEDAALAALPH